MADSCWSLIDAKGDGMASPWPVNAMRQAQNKISISHARETGPTKTFEPWLLST